VTAYLLLCCLLGNAPAAAEVTASTSIPTTLSMQDAEDLALQRNRQLLAASLQVSLAEIELLAAGLWSNPELSFSSANLVLGQGNPQETNLHPKFAEQTINSVQLAQTLDIWAKRGLRKQTAAQAGAVARLLLDDAVRQVRHAVRSAFAEVLREQWEKSLAAEMRRRYDRTVVLSQKRLQAGDISAAEQSKFSLEKLKYVNAETDATLELSLARARLANILAYPSAAALPAALQDTPAAPQPQPAEALLQQAWQTRPDLRATVATQTRATAQAAQARREVYPDVQLSLGYTRSYFQISGDNPHSLSFGLGLPLPLFDRQQAARATAEVALQQANNDAELLRLAIAEEVAGATQRLQRAQLLLDVFEGDMLQRADSALSVAEKSYQIGATNLLELLEAQRTYLETRASYLSTRYDFRQAVIDVNFAVGRDAL
jgi:cobalt-zinc-cadmium efflux system outer membrane protein